MNRMNPAGFSRFPGFGLYWIVLLVANGCMTGCRSGEYEPSEEDRIYEVISGIADAAATEDSFVAFFANPATAPRDRRADYGRYSYQAPTISIDGDMASAEVEIVQPLDDSVLATATWKLQKKGETWLLLEAEWPSKLPAPKPAG
ncbi:MAG: hypothetical protein JW829_15440 [Pirellulales bacterium]|nr:hypothetical protein [Pirellulales bacterium]